MPRPVVIACLTLLLAWPQIGTSVDAMIIGQQPAQPPTSTATQESEPVWSLGRVGQYGGSSYGVAIEGGYAFLAFGARLVAFDISDASMPRRVGQFALSSTVTAVEVGGNVAFVAEVKGALHALDISDPAALVEIGRLEVSPSGGATTWQIRDLVIRSGELYAAAGDAGLAVIDVANPGEMRILATSEGGEAVDVDVNDGYAFVAASGAGLRIVDVREPGSPQEVALFDVGEDDAVLGVAVANERAYLSRLHWGYATSRALASPADPIPTVSYLTIVDVSDPLQPEQLGEVRQRVMYFPGRLVARGEMVYQYGTGYSRPGTSSGGMLVVMDVADPSEIEVSGQLAPPASIADLRLSGDLLFAAQSDGGMGVVDVSDGTNPTLVSRQLVPTGPRAIAASDGLLAAGDHGTGWYWNVDASNPADMVEAGFVGVGGICAADCDLAISEGMAYLADINDGLFLFDNSDLSSPRNTAHVAAADGAVAVAVDGSHAYVGARPDGSQRPSMFLVVDATEPTQPLVVGQLEMRRNMKALAHAGDYAYSLTGDGLGVIDVGDPGNPKLLTSVLVGYHAQYVAARGQLAFVAESSGRLHVLNISRPSEPVTVGILEPPAGLPDRDRLKGLAVSGNLVFLAHQYGLRLADVSMPTQPRAIDWLGLEELGSETGIHEIAVDGDSVYLVDQDDGLISVQVLRRTLPHVIHLPALSKKR